MRYEGFVSRRLRARRCQCVLLAGWGRHLPVPPPRPPGLLQAAKLIAAEQMQGKTATAEGIAAEISANQAGAVEADAGGQGQRDWKGRRGLRR